MSAHGAVCGAAWAQARRAPNDGARASVRVAYGRLGRTVDCMARRWALMLVLASALVGCAGTYEVVRPPLRHADLYPMSQTTDGISVAVDEMSDPERVERYFGANLIGRSIVPVAVIVSNDGSRRVTVRPSDILAHRGEEIIDPLPLPNVVWMAQSQHWMLRAGTEREVGRYFQDLAFQSTVLSPGDTYQGILFFYLPEPRDSGNPLFSVLQLFPESRIQMMVETRDLDTGDRVRFGPFYLSVPDSDDSD